LSIFWFFLFFAVIVLAFLLYFGPSRILAKAGQFLVVDEKPIRSDAIVVLCSGVDYYPRLMEAAHLFRKGFGKKIVINGNRKNTALRELESKGFKTCCAWHEPSVRILSLLGIPKKKIMHMSVEDAYDTISEADAVGNELVRQGIKRIILTTSKFHTKRAHFIWTEMFENRLAVHAVAAPKDPFDPNGWWKDGRQIRWVLSEYGAWVYYYWKKIKENSLFEFTGLKRLVTG
jgi:uncharacterized SAM-binding protein YcdF (DUF218 family)